MIADEAAENLSREQRYRAVIVEAVQERTGVALEAVVFTAGQTITNTDPRYEDKPYKRVIKSGVGLHFTNALGDPIRLGIQTKSAEEKPADYLDRACEYIVRFNRQVVP